MKTDRLKATVQILDEEYYRTYEKMLSVFTEGEKRFFDYLYDNDIVKLDRLFMEDEHLNNIPMWKIDQLFSFVNGIVSSRGALPNSNWKNLALSQNTSLVKHYLIFEVLGVTVKFREYSI